MPNTQLSDEQISWVTQEVAGYIARQRETFKNRAVPLNAQQMAAMEGFFPQATLQAARVKVLEGERVGNPPFYPQLRAMGFSAEALPNFARMAAITFVDTIVSHEAFDRQLLFHELVHVVQYEKLGATQFAAKYVSGFLRGGAYEAIPLEVNAYELDGRYAAEPETIFSVEEQVAAWLSANRF